MDEVDANRQSDSNKTQVDAASVHLLPAGADFLMCYSVAEGAWGPEGSGFRWGPEWHQNEAHHGEWPQHWLHGRLLVPVF